MNNNPCTELSKMAKLWDVWSIGLTKADFPDSFYYGGRLITKVERFLNKLAKMAKRGERPTDKQIERLILINNRHVKTGKTRRV